MQALPSFVSHGALDRRGRRLCTLAVKYLLPNLFRVSRPHNVVFRLQTLAAPEHGGAVSTTSYDDATWMDGASLRKPAIVGAYEKNKYDEECQR
jgi:hypothetical protein